MRFGRDYEYKEWLNSLVEPEGEVTDQMRDSGTVLRVLVDNLWFRYCLEMDLLSEYETTDDDKIAYLFHMTVQGAGVGFWDRDELTLVEFCEWLEGKKQQPFYVVANSISEDLDVAINEVIYLYEVGGR